MEAADTTLMAMYERAKSFLLPIYTHRDIPSHRPLLTLTYAQSIDSKIALQGKPLLLSGKESMTMTHRLRVLHEAILVGSGTAFIDDPQLNARHLPLNEAYQQPQPVILDTRLQLPAACRLIKNYQDRNGKQPWIITSSSAMNSDRKSILENAGAKIFPLELSASTGHLEWKDILGLLSEQGIQSVMVEGGSRVIRSCLTSGYVDQLIVTIAPIYVGDEGVNVSASAKLDNVQYQVFGKDIVMAAQILSSQ